MRIIGELHTFNTGRRYVADGQTIVWAIIAGEDGQKVAFIDRARMIEGVIDLHFGNLDLVDDRWVLRAYDDHHYHADFKTQWFLRQHINA